MEQSRPEVQDDVTQRIASALNVALIDARVSVPCASGRTTPMSWI
jgi:hypothetical protein